LDEPKKKVLIIRWGAFGDHIFLTPIYPLLKADGYHVTVYSTKQGLSILKGNPYVDKIILRPPEFEKDYVTKEELAAHWKEVSKGYDKVINFTGSIEESLLKSVYQKDFSWNQDRLMKECNVNYADRMLEIAGYPHIKGKTGQLFFSKQEKQLAKKLRKKWSEYFMIVWPLSGSSVHKSYPWTDLVASELLSKYPDIMIISTGDMVCRAINFPNHPRIKDFTGKWSFRKAMTILPYADLVIGSDTGLLQAAGCFDTPKVLMLSSNTKECLAKYWENVTCLSADVECHPCFRLHYSMETCNFLKTESGKPVAPMCTIMLHPDKIYDAIEHYYLKWREKNHGRNTISWRPEDVFRGGEIIRLPLQKAAI
jgi:ADP-heptose:LPS heptosyltransferase